MFDNNQRSRYFQVQCGVYSLVQSLITNDISKLINKENVNLMSIYGLFLNPKGRIITDAIITRPKVYSISNNRIIKKFTQNQLWVDVDREAKNALIDHLKRYSWKKKITFGDAGNGVILYAGYNQLPDQIDLTLQGFEVLKEGEVEGEIGNYSQSVIYDPRSIKLGVRIISGSEGIEGAGGDFFNDATSKQYQRHSNMLGLCKTSDLIGKLPFQFNIDIMNGVSFSKGCYLGQQLVSRSYFTGIIRRRIFPYVLSEGDKKLEVNSVINGQDNREMGKVIRSEEGYGIALINYLDYLNNEWPLKFISPIKGQILSPFHQKIKQYYAEMLKKQTKLQQILD